MKRYRTDWMLRGMMAICMLFVGYVPRGSAQEDPRLWTAGPYSFSDELGGFIIRSISGTGTMQDPIILTEEFPSVTPTTLIIRTEKVTQLNPSEDAGIYSICASGPPTAAVIPGSSSSLNYRNSLTCQAIMAMDFPSISQVTRGA